MKLKEICILCICYLDVDTPVVSVSNPSPVENVDNVTFTCNVNTTDTNKQYVWYLGNTPISGETGIPYTLTREGRDKAGDYSCKVTTDNSLTQTSDAVTVSILCKCCL